MKDAVYLVKIPKNGILEAHVPQDAIGSGSQQCTMMMRCKRGPEPPFKLGEKKKNILAIARVNVLCSFLQESVVHTVAHILSYKGHMCLLEGATYASCAIHIQ